VSQPAAQDPAESTSSVERRRVHLDLAGLARGLDQERLLRRRRRSSGRRREGGQAPGLEEAGEARIPRRRRVEVGRDQGLATRFGESHWILRGALRLFSPKNKNERGDAI